MTALFSASPITHIIDLLLLTFVVLICYGLTDKFLGKYISVKFSSFAEKFVFFAGLGLGIVAYIVLIFGLLGLLFSWLFYIFLIIGLLVSFDKIIAIFKSIKLPQLSKLDIILVLLMIIFVLSALLSALAPPIAIDESMYHLAIPKLFVEQHKVFNASDNMRSSWVMNQEMLFTLGYLLKGDILAKLFHFLMGILTMVAVYAFSRTIMPRSPSLLASLIFISTPIVFWLSTVGNNDLCFTFFSLLAVFAAAKHFTNKGESWLMFSAIFCGLAIGTKYLGAFTFASIAASLIMFNFAHKKERIFKPLIIFGLIAAAVCLVWYVRNYIYVQNPIFPFLNNIFRSKFWFSQYYDMDLELFGTGRGLLDYLLLPWNLTFRCNAFSRVGYIGPFYMMALPLLFFIAKKEKLPNIVKFILMFSSVYFFFWIFSSQYLRYLMPAFPALSIAAAYAIYRITSFLPKGSYKAVMAVVLAAIFLSLPFFTTLWVNSKLWWRYTYTTSYSDYDHPEELKLFKLARKVVFGNISRDDYLSTNSFTAGSYPLIKYANENFTKNSKIFTVYDFLRCYYKVPVRADFDYFPEYGTTIQDLFADPEYKYYKGMWTDDFYNKLKQLHFTHLLVNFVNLRLAGVDPVEDTRFFIFANKHLKIIKFARDGALYEIKYDN